MGEYLLGQKTEVS